MITLLTPTVLDNFTGAQIFTFFSLMMVLQLLWVRFKMPETKGVSLEDLQKRLIKEEE